MQPRSLAAKDTGLWTRGPRFESGRGYLKGQTMTVWLAFMLITGAVAFFLLQSGFSKAYKSRLEGRMFSSLSLLASRASALCDSLSGTSEESAVWLAEGWQVSKRGNKLCASSIDGEKCFRIECNFTSKRAFYNESLLTPWEIAHGRLEKFAARAEKTSSGINVTFRKV